MLHSAVTGIASRLISFVEYSGSHIEQLLLQENEWSVLLPFALNFESSALSKGDFKKNCFTAKTNPIILWAFFRKPHLAVALFIVKC